MATAYANRVEVTGAVRRYGAVRALAGVDLVVEPGELLTLLGPSGSGKTTLLKIVAGYDRPDEGRVRVGDADITHMPPARRNIGMVFQSYALFPHMTVAENIAFPLEMRRLPKPDIAARIDRVLASVGLAGMAGRRPSQLSGGQQQRVALARAIVFEPALLLLDEPFGALDKKLREQMQLEVKALQRRIGVTTLFVTHDQEEALVLSDRIAVMNAGRIEQLGRPQDIYARPVNRFVADFIGDSNILRAKVEAADGAGGFRAVAATGLPLKLASADRSAPPRGADIAVVLRPEHPRPVASGAAPDNRARGRVLDVVYLGESIKYRIGTNADTVLQVRWPAAEGGIPLAPGAEVEIGWPATAMHWVPWS